MHSPKYLIKTDVLKTAGFYWLVASRCPWPELLRTVEFKFRGSLRFIWMTVSRVWLVISRTSLHHPCLLPKHRGVLSDGDGVFLWMINSCVKWGCRSWWWLSTTQVPQSASGFLLEATHSGTQSCAYEYHAQRDPKWFPGEHIIKAVITQGKNKIRVENKMKLKVR